MNTEACANCLVHGWEQLNRDGDATKLLQCQNCKLILYCGKECQLEHWNKVHSRHCEYFADPTKNEPWQHKEQDCVICQQAAAVGESTLMQAENPNYECIHKTLHKLPQDLHHPHSFPVTGQPGDIREKAVIVLWQLVNKFRLIHPNVARVCENEFLEVENALVNERLEQKCSFCFKEVFISNEYFSTDGSHPSNIFFSVLLLGKYNCGSEDCTDQSNQMVIHDHRFSIELGKMWCERSENTCDFCFQLTPIKQVGSVMRDIHRCSYCRTTMYCSMECLHQDWKIHLKVCHKDKDGRKKKLGGSARREVARETLEKFEKVREK